MSWWYTQWNIVLLIRARAVSRYTTIQCMCIMIHIAIYCTFNNPLELKSLVTDEDLTQKMIGFRPVLPYPVTEYTVVYTALKNFQDILSQLDQSHLPITCDEGVYHIARAIIMNNPTEFSNLVLCLRSFHLIMGAIGKYIEGSGAEIILAESKAFGENVARSVLLSECFERLQWAEFFRIRGVREYMNELSLMQLMKPSAAEKNREESRAHLETFAFWDRFVKMVSILRDLVRANCKGTWGMHLQSVQAVLPLFAGCDRINYLSWGSVYLEDMRKLAQDAPSVFENFKAGKFMVKRTEGQFTAVGADMCLEQTINRSQKSAGGIIGSTKRKQFVAQWEIIHHEMSAVVNLQCTVSGVVTPSQEFLVNHEFILPPTWSSEANIEDMIGYIKEHDNPVTSSAQKSKNDMQILHNIISQEVMPPGNARWSAQVLCHMHHTLWNLSVWTICHKTTIDLWHNPQEKSEDIQKQDGWEAVSSNKSERKQEATGRNSEDLWHCQSTRVRHTGIADLLPHWHQLSLWCRRPDGETK